MTIKSGTGVALASVAFVFFSVGAGWIALRLIRSNRAAVISMLPLVPEQSVAVAAPGELVVSVEVPRLTTEYRQWEIEIAERKSQRVHSMKWGGPRATGAVTGLSTIKIPIGRINLLQSDTLTVRVKGLVSPDAGETSQLVFARPHLARMALQIVGLVIGGVGTLLSLLWALWLVGLLKASA